MENLVCEVYFEYNPFREGVTLVDVYSHKKAAWVYSGQVAASDALSLIKDIGAKPQNSLIHICSTHPSVNEIKGAGYQIKHFKPYNGTYRLLDNTEYTLRYVIPSKPPKSKRQLTAQCIKSVVRDLPLPDFPVSEDQIDRNIRFGSWTLIN